MNKIYTTYLRSKKSVLDLIIVAVFSLIVRVPFFKWHINPDSGPFAYYAALKKDINLKLGVDLPVTAGFKIILYYIYRLSAILFGDHLRGERIFAALFNILTTIVLFIFAKDLFGTNVAFVSSLFYAFFSSVPAFEGYKTTIETYAILLILIIYYLSCKSSSMNLLTLVTIYLMIGFLVSIVVIFFKLTFVIECLGALIWVVYNNSFSFLNLWIIIGIILGLFFFYAIAKFGGYWNRNLIIDSFKQLLLHGSKYQKNFYFIVVRLVYFLSLILLQSLPVWILGCYGCYKLMLISQNSMTFLLLFFLSSSLLELVLQRAFYPQMFIMLLPPLCILASVAVCDYMVFGYNLNTIIISIPFFIVIFNLSKFYVTKEFKNAEKYLPTGLLYRELESLGDYIQENTKVNDYILQWGEMVQLNAFAKRKSPFTDTYMYIHPSNDDKYGTEWKKKFVKSIKTHQPVFIIVTCREFPNFEFIKLKTGLVYEKFTKEVFTPFQLFKLKKEINSIGEKEVSTTNGMDLFYSYDQNHVIDKIYAIHRFEITCSHKNPVLLFSDFVMYPYSNRL